jgi:hypothetical protein
LAAPAAGHQNRGVSFNKWVFIQALKLNKSSNGRNPGFARCHVDNSAVLNVMLAEGIVSAVDEIAFQSLLGSPENNRVACVTIAP